MNVATTDSKVRVLFIDDETNVLNGLRRLLRTHRDRWEMHFASSGAEAIQKMRAIAFDVIVSDMRMPEMDGAEVLLVAKKLAPLALRCVLSGQADRDQTLRVLESAHQFLSKPCDTEVLENVVSKSIAAKRRLPHDGLRALVTSIHSLPILPAHWLALLEEIGSKESSVDRLSDIVASDLALSAKVLQLVNSSFFGQPKNILCPKSATKLLGVELFVELAIRRRILRGYEGHWPAAYPVGAFAEESAAVAQIAHEITWNKTGSAACAQEAYLAGLFHGIGKLILAEHRPSDYEIAVAQSKTSEQSLLDCEQSVLGANHVQVGCGLLSLWGLPTSVIEAIEACQRPLDADASFTVSTALQNAIQLKHNQQSLNDRLLV